MLRFSDAYFFEEKPPTQAIWEPLDHSTEVDEKQWRAIRDNPLLQIAQPPLLPSLRTRVSTSSHFCRLANVRCISAQRNRHFPPLITSKCCLVQRCQDPAIPINIKEEIRALRTIRFKFVPAQGGEPQLERGLSSVSFISAAFTETIDDSDDETVSLHREALDTLYDYSPPIELMSEPCSEPDGPPSPLLLDPHPNLRKVSFKRVLTAVSSKPDEIFQSDDKGPSLPRRRQSSRLSTHHPTRSRRMRIENLDVFPDWVKEKIINPRQTWLPGNRYTVCLTKREHISFTQRQEHLSDMCRIRRDPKLWKQLSELFEWGTSNEVCAVGIGDIRAMLSITLTETLLTPWVGLFAFGCNTVTAGPHGPFYAILKARCTRNLPITRRSGHMNVPIIHPLQQNDIECFLVPSYLERTWLVQNLNYAQSLGLLTPAEVMHTCGRIHTYATYGPYLARLEDRPHPMRDFV